MNKTVKVGRPNIENEKKQFTKQKHNQSYYLNVTKNKRLLHKVISYRALENKKVSAYEYKQAIITHFSKYHFTDFFTGTANPNYLQKEQIEIYNKKYKEINKEYQTDYALKKYIPISLNSFKRYTGKYLTYLIELNIIDRGIVFYEQNKSKEWHCHLIVNVVNKYIKDVSLFLEDKWLLGISLNVPIPTIEDKTSLLLYSTKQLSIYGRQKSDKDKVLSWEIFGDFMQPKRTTKNETKMKKFKKEQIEAIEKFKEKNGLITTFDPKHQKMLNDRFVRFSA
ncbi:hypothetical protein [Pedobacter frigiditerrae]|uniref:hypothetical protein n=1 Tax=Pedobacter frigiditerrae TaxID=2530452 RepID=UPI002931ED6D|nr:hypothetical protein [Pedobacter frigiditerrae]